MVIHQGDVYWLDFALPSGSGPGYKHPHVEVQNNVFNQSRIKTTVVCAVTSNLNLGSAPGNVLLKKGEARDLVYLQRAKFGWQARNVLNLSRLNQKLHSSNNLHYSRVS